MNKKKILYLMPRMIAAGAETLILEYVKKLVVDGYDVAVASVVGGGELAAEFKKLTERVYVGLKREPINYYKNIVFLRGLVRDWKPDIIHSHIFSADLAAYFLKRKNRQIRWISTAHNVEHKNSNWKKIIWRKILRRADLILAVSEQVEKFYGQKFSLPQKKMVVLRNGIELEDWFELKSGDILQKQELLLANIGRLEYQKGQDILLRALYKVRDLNWKMYIYGEGSWRERLKKMTTSLGLNGKVKFKGVSLNLPYEMPEIDVVIQPSRWEGNSLVIMEAMAAGRGIIASSPAAEGLLAAEKTGLVVKKEDAEALADAIRTVFIKKEKIRAMAGEAQNYARLHFSIESHMEKLKRIYDYV